MTTISRETLMPWIIKSLEDMGDVDISDMKFEFELKKEGPDADGNVANMTMFGPEVVTELFVAAALFLSEDKGQSFLDALDEFSLLPEDIDFDKLTEENLSMKLIVDFSDINNPTVQSENLSGKGFLVSLVYLANKYGEDMGENVMNILLRVTERLMKMHEKIDFIEKDKEEAK